MAHLKLYVFGAPRLEYDGQPIELNLRKALALLVYLAVTGQPHSRDALATLFWPESDQGHGRARLRRTLHRLNQGLEAKMLDICTETIRLHAEANLWLDSALFREHVRKGLPALPAAAMAPERIADLDAAVALYTDEFLAGFTLLDSPAFDEWQFFQRESLRQLYGQMLEQLIAAYRAAQAWERAIGYARRWVAFDGLHEPAQRTLMQLYAAAGQPAAALRQYQECVRILDAELGVAPEEATTALYDAIRTRQFAPAAAAARLPARPPVMPDAAPHERYATEERLASGGQGVVYRGLDRTTGQPVAIKRLKSELIARHPDALARFVREGSALRQLNHPNIVSVLAAFEHAGQDAIVMEYVPGGSLRALLERERQLPLERVLAIGLELADALGRAHHLGIIHRDLKPENVLLAADDTPRLSDFGLARLDAEASTLTQSGALFGSPAYMSPEAVRGEELDARSDIWSLGVLLYELLAGRRPFEGAQITPVLASILEDPVPDLEQFRGDVPPGPGALLGRMLVKERAQRLARMRQVAAALEALRAGSAAEGLVAEQGRQVQAVGASAPAVAIPSPTDPAQAHPAGAARTPPVDEVRELARPLFPSVEQPPMAAALLATKLYVPAARPNLVARPRLLERLHAGLLGKLTLIAAPAGFGKTTLLTQAAGPLKMQPPACPHPQAVWVSLDAGDNDPTRFWSYVFAALDTLLRGWPRGRSGCSSHRRRRPWRQFCPACSISTSSGCWRPLGRGPTCSASTTGCPNGAKTTSKTWLSR